MNLNVDVLHSFWKIELPVWISSHVLRVTAFESRIDKFFGGIEGDLKRLT